MVKNDKRVYLCGGINGLQDSECKDWREYAKANLKFATLDPMRRDYRGRELDLGVPEEIVAGDLADIQEAMFVLVMHPRPSTGADMEVVLAHREFGKIVVTVIPEGHIASPWLIVHSSILVRSLDNAIAWINGFAKQ